MYVCRLRYLYENEIDIYVFISEKMAFKVVIEERTFGGSDRIVKNVY